MLQAYIWQAYKTHLLDRQQSTICVQKIQLTKKKYGLWYRKTSKKFINNRTLHLQRWEHDITTINVHDPTKANDIKVSYNFHEEHKYIFNQ